MASIATGRQESNETTLSSKMQQEKPRSKVSSMTRIRYASTAFGALYLAALILLAIPFIQTHTVYLNAIRIPWYSNFERPEDYGLAPGKTYNFNLQTPDNVMLGSWFILSDPYYRSQAFPPASSPSLEIVQDSIRTHPTILFFHGNAGTRAFHVRIAHYQAYSSRLGANVLAIDYRGFGDSTGVPTENGLAIDARTAWNWLIENGAAPEDVLIVGHSLGTGVSARLAGELSNDGVPYRGVVLMSPFSSIETLIRTYSIFGLFPIMKPLAFIPRASQLAAKALIHKFDTLHMINNITGNLLIAHAEDDWNIPHTHADTLFDAILEPYLPELFIRPQNPLEWTQEQQETFKAQNRARREARENFVSTTEIYHLGAMQELALDQDRRVILLKTQKGGHDRLGIQEGVQDVMSMLFVFDTFAI